MLLILLSNFSLRISHLLSVIDWFFDVSNLREVWALLKSLIWTYIRLKFWWLLSFELSSTINHILGFWGSYTLLKITSSLTRVIPLILCILEFSLIGKNGVISMMSYLCLLIDFKCNSLIFILLSFGISIPLDRLLALTLWVLFFLSEHVIIDYHSYLASSSDMMLPGSISILSL